MIHAADVREWRNRDVVNTESHKIGVLEAVPLEDAIAGPDHLKVGYVKTLVKQAPSIGTDDVLPAEQEEAIFKHYGLAYKPGAAGERQLARR
ncbi:PRC-barrel domain containing protein [Streptomyces flaveus]|uniref:PRC-barrel domain containing protein n=1 Tax=Streptomyces flaveus TaxID=66370 RepID=UPI00332BB8FD